MANEKRLIDANPLIKRFSGGDAMKSLAEAVHDERFVRELQNAPTVDAVEVVRCKDCKHYRSYGPGTDGFESFGKCLLIDMDVDMPVNGYCCYGERRDANDKML